MDVVTTVAFTVHGTPAPQGSKTSGRTKAGVTYLRETNPELAPWRTAVAAAAAAAMNGGPQLTGPVRLEATFVFPRPRSHYRVGKHAGQLKPAAPTYCARRPDLDKLLRAIGDAITGIVVVDDAQVVELVAQKHYGAPAAHVTVEGYGP